VNPFYSCNFGIKYTVVLKKVLVTGGCGYIGSHTLLDLIEHGYNVVCVDSLVNSDTSPLVAIKAISDYQVPHFTIDMCNADQLDQVFQKHQDIDAVIHFAALKHVGESVQQPLKYYKNNLESLMNLLESMGKWKVNNLIFSSSCSVYGQVEVLPATENSPLQNAECPYAYTKQAGERIIIDYCIANPEFQANLLRYFNPAGAHPSALMGESSINPPSNLVPVVTEVARGIRSSLTVFGSDYPTRDGTCIRDFIHVIDIANAHTKAAGLLINGDQIKNVEIFNLGSGIGVTVLEAIHAFEKASGIDLNYELGPRREGDVVAVYADNTKAKQILAWAPQYDMEDIMRTAWAWDIKRK